MRRLPTILSAIAILTVLTVAFFYPLCRAAGAILADSKAGDLIAAYPAKLESKASARGYAAYGGMPNCFTQGIVSVEDKRFFSHAGIDPLALARMALESASNDKEDHGGSTITEQLARMILRIPRLQPSFAAEAGSQVRIVGATLILEHEFSKQKILELYLNSIYFGRGASGPAAAARAYFGKDLGVLDEGQCLYLAGLPQAPTLFGEDPAGSYAHERYLHVIARMQRDGRISAEKASILKAEQLFSNK